MLSKIADNSTTTSIISVTDNGIVGDNILIKNLTLSLAHVNNRDLSITLTSPEGTTLNLSIKNGDISDHYTYTKFIDAGGDITGATGPFTGEFRPQGGTFATAFAGQNINGDWILSITDDKKNDEGTFNYVSLDFAKDADRDGIFGRDDLDSDNDGVLDIDEGSTCFKSESVFEVTTELTYNGPINNVFDGVLTQEGFYFNTQNYPGNETEIFRISLEEAIVITQFRILHDTSHDLADQNGSFFLGNSVSYKIQGSNDGINWDILILNAISNGDSSGEEKILDFINTAAYDTYRIVWTGGQIRYNPWIEEILFSVSPCSQTSLDSDSDLIVNYLDLDSDNDGVYGSVESGVDPSLLDAKGRIDIATNGVNADGVPIDANGGAGFTLVDTDNDNTPNIYDLDSDGDGCSDANEYYFKADADGRDDAVFGLGTPVVDKSTGLVSATYDGSNYSDALDNTITKGCQFIQVISGNWDTNSKWEARAVPMVTDDVIIRAHSTVTQNQSVNSLTLEPGYTISVNPGQAVNVKGDLTNLGDFNGDGYLVFNGNASQKIIGNGTDAGSFTHMRLNNPAGVTLTDDADLFDVIEIDAGDFNVKSGKFMTFKSSKGRTAVVGKVNNGTIKGCVVVERYIPPKRAFRYIASPVTTTIDCGKPTIKENLQEGEQVVDFTNYNPETANQEFGTHITGSKNGANGFDATQTGNPSMFVFNNASQTFSSIPNTNELGLTVGTPYALIIRGGRDMNLNINNTLVGNETILRFTGELSTGDQPVPNLTDADSNYNFVANPYQAQVHLGELLLNDATDIQKTKVWVYDPTIGGAHGSYTFLSFNNNGQLEAKMPFNSEVNEYLQPNQSFFVENEPRVNDTNLTFKEIRKKAADHSSTNAVFRANPPQTSMKVSIDLYHSDTDNLRDGVQVRFENNFKDGYEAAEDAFKFWNSQESIATSLNNGIYLTLDKRRYDASDKVVHLFIRNYRATNYTFKMDINNPGLHDIYLIDNYLDTKTLIGTKRNSYSFKVDRSVPASRDANRFQLNFEKSKKGPKSKTAISDNDEFESNGIKLYPNPVKDKLTVNLSLFKGKMNSLNIYDITGKLISNQDILSESTDLEINMENYSSGLYILQIDAEDGSQFHHKLIIE